MVDPVVPSEYVAHLRAVTAELAELIPTVASTAGRGRALLDAYSYDVDVDAQVLVEQIAATAVSDLGDVAELLASLLDLRAPLEGDVLVDLMWRLDYLERS